MGVLHFESHEAYKKYLAYGHIHGVFEKTKGNQRIFIAGKEHHVTHKR